MRLLGWLVLALCLSVGAVAGLDSCKEPVSVGDACVVVSPVLGCSSPEYWVYNLSGGLSDSGNMSLLNNSIYEFTFNESVGGYIVKFCDNSTREVLVVQGGDEGNMIIATIIFLPMLLSVILLLGALVLDKERHAALRIFLWMLSLLCFVLSLNWSLISVVEFYNFPELQEAIGSATYWFSLVFVAIICYWFIYIIYVSFMMFKKKREDREMAEWHQGGDTG